MMKRLIQILILAASTLAITACSDDSPGDVCATLNPPSSCEAENNENKVNNDNNTNNENENNVNNLSCDPECSGETPVCSDGACVECVEGADCESGVCDETTDTCTGCVDNDECTGATPRCDAGMCVACDTASDEGCGGETPFCETVDGDAVCVACDTPGSTGACPVDTVCTDAYVCSACESNDKCTEADASVCESPGTEAASCVACSEASDCSHIDGTNQCDGGTCVVCTEATSDSDCTAADASRCDTSGAEPVCAGCSDVSDCSHIADANHCIGDTCVECTQATEDVDCNGNVCDLSTNTCTTFGIGSALACGTCVSDTHCFDGNYCIPLDFDGNFHGNYCMPIPEAGTQECYRPTVASQSRTTIDGLTIDICVIDESNTTCEAVRASGSSCTTSGEPAPGECGADGTTAPGAICSGGSCTFACVESGEC